MVLEKLRNLELDKSKEEREQLAKIEKKLIFKKLFFYYLFLIIYTLSI